MSNILDSLLSLLSLEQLDDNLFRGQPHDIGFGHLFGGHVMGQALNAAKQTVSNARSSHSLHAYFLRAGDPKKSIIYQVENLRDGGSFSARSVHAIQSGRPIFMMTCSFQSQESGLEHQISMPNVSGPEGVLNHQELAKSLAGSIPQSLLSTFTKPSPFEMRVVDPLNPINPEKSAPTKQVWIRANGQVPDDPRVHKYLLAYASDFNFLVTAAQPHGVSFLTPGMKMATIDHSMWFHHEINMNDWILFNIESPSSSGGRGFVKGHFYDSNGKLVASATQEGLMRISEKHK
ncbi:acyl-CoA thioesterase II [Parashewanella curva]|uniref:Acyl-CoA thioesterase 2 n=1 Tax=Parashewanella curva TaxID=2338552 RepID=A0A3L8PWI7_9GAMM|nr:acyl-CoA thioesterase II [Parashewanella curva]RLV59726.1 acyl-CoA thioesterase II [Parashewanella curva]